MLDPLVLFGKAHEVDKMVHDRCDDFGLVDLFTGPRAIEQSPVAVNEPLTRLIECLAKIFDVVALTGAPLIEGPRRAARKKERRRGRIQLRNSQSRGLPRLVGQHIHVAQLRRCQARQRFNIRGERLKCPATQGGRLSGGRIDSVFDAARDIVIELVG